MDWQKIEEAVALALEIPLERRQSWLDEFCAGDAKLKAEVESLLAFENESEKFLETPISSRIAAILPDEHKETFSGKQFGNYKIIREIGRGGMGAVFLAERADGEFKQQAAVKIVRQTFIDKESENRFRRERQILAALNHPNIARLLDGGVSDKGEPFLVMEYIEGEPLLEYAESKKLSFSERLQLFVEVCSAVAFAHQNLIVHRDIKPANILVNSDGEPKLLDFGLAKITDENLLDEQTATAFRAMTPAYASPEQVRGESVTTASDVYSLGIVLYELLIESRPFEFKTNRFEEIVRVVSNAEPLRPSSALKLKFQSLNPKLENNKNPKFKIQNPKSLQGDLDNIILTALRKEPERRYKTVEAFAEDIKKHLAGLPVSARANTFGYRAGKFIKRNIAVSAIGALLLISLLGGITMTVWQARVAGQERDRAEKRFNDVRKLSTSLLFEISPQIERLPSSTQARETIVKRALEYLDSLATEANTDESLQSELATAYEQVGNVQGKPGNPNLGDLDGAIESYGKAQAIRLRLVEKSNADYEARRLLANNYYSIGDLQYWSSQIAESMKNYRQATQIYESLIAEQPENFDVELDSIRTQLAIAKVHSSNGEYDDSIPIYRRAIESLESLRLKNPNNTGIPRLATGCHINLAYDLSWKDEMNEAGAEVEKSLAIAEPLFAANPNDTKLRHSLWYSYYFAGSVFQDANPMLARKFLQKSVNLARESAENDRVDYQSKHDLAQSYSLLGVISDTQKDSDQAVKFYEKASKILQDLIKDEPRHTGYPFDLANTYTRLGVTQKEKKDLENARQSFENALAIQEKMREKDSADNMQLRGLAFSNENLGQVYELMKQCDKAESYFQMSYQLYSELAKNNALSDYDKKRIEKQKASKICKEKLI